MGWVETSGKGKLAAYTTIAVGPSFMMEKDYDRDNHYCAGIVTLEEGLRVNALILGVDTQHPERIEIGMPVEVKFVGRGEGASGATLLAFHPIINEATRHRTLQH